MAFKIVKGETGKGNGQQTVMFDSITKKHFVVSSVSGGFVDETYIFVSDKDGNVENYAEVWGTRPADHDGVINALLTGDITALDFY
jgi:hypothetical protein